MALGISAAFIGFNKKMLKNISNNGSIFFELIVMIYSSTFIKNFEYILLWIKITKNQFTNNELFIMITL
jgi:hypothetical protein